MSEKRKDRGEKRILKMVKKGKVEKKKRISKPHNGSGEAYKLLFEQSTDGIAIISKKKIVMANEAFCAIHELPMEKVIGANPCDFIHPEEREAAIKRIEALLRGKPTPESHVYRALKGDGSVIWAEVSTKKIKWEGEIALQSLVRDITERKRAEETLQESERRFRALIEHSSDGIALIDRDGKILYESLSIGKILGYGKKEMIGKNVLDLINPDDVQNVENLFSKILQKTDSSASTQARYEHRNGSWQWIEGTATNLLSEPDVGAIVVNYRDITERKRAEEKLRESEERFRTTLEKIEDGYYEVDLAGNFTFFNDSMSKMLGYTREEMAGMNNRQYMDADTARIVYRIFNEVYETGKATKAIGWELVRKDNSKLFVETSITLMRDKSGTPVGFRGICRNITERKEAEDALRKSEEKFAKVFRCSPDAVMITRLTDGYLIEVNEAFSRISGYERNEAIGHGTLELDLWANSADREQYVRLLRENGRVTNFETTIRTKSGEIRYVLASSEIIGIVGENCMISVVRDITERKQAEGVLKESEQRLKEAQTMGRIGNWIFYPTSQKIEWSDEAYELYERDKTLGPPSVEEEALYYPPEEAARLHEFARLAIEKGEESRYDLTAQLPSGKTAFFNASMHPVKDDKGNVIKLFGTVQDITERKMMEAALQASEENFHNSLDNSPLGIRIVSKDGETLYANKAILDIYGYESTEEFKATPIRKRYTPESYEQHLVRREKREKGELVPSDYEISIVRKDGTVRHLQVFRKEVLWGGMKQFQVLYVDITERKKAEEALRAAEIKYRSLVERVPCVVYLTTFGKNAPWLYVSPQIEILLGFTAEEWRGDNTLWFRQIHSDDQERIANFEGTQTPYDFEYRMFTKEGRIVWVHDYAIILPNEKGEPYYQQGFLVDITERKKAEEKLSAIHRVTEELALSLDVDHIAGATADIVQDILEFSDFTIDLIDEEKQELRVKAYRGFFEKTDKKASSLKENGITLWVANHGQSLLVPDVSKDERYVEWFPKIKSELCVPLKVKEKTIGVMDVESEKIDAFSEEDRMLLETLASGAAIAIENAQLYGETKQSKLQLEFVTDLMSHDLSNINQIALSSVEILSESELSEHQKKFLISTMSAVRRSAGLVSNFKVLQGMLRGQGEKEKKELSSIIEKAMKNFSDYPGKTITIEYVPQQGQIIMADDYLSKVFDNLFDNAIKFTPQEQVRIAVEVFEEKDCFKIRICDWGKGVSDKMKEEIFRRYEKLQEGKLGTGLGLYTAKKIVENHGGRIWVYDNPEGGSVFCVELPRFPAMLK